MNDRPNRRRPSDIIDPIPSKRQLVENCELDEDLSSDGDFECSGEQDDRTWQPTESDLEEFQNDIGQNNFENIRNSEINNASASTSPSQERIALITVNATRDEVPNEVSNNLESAVIRTEQIGRENSSCGQFKIEFQSNNIIFPRECKIFCKTKKGNAILSKIAKRGANYNALAIIAIHWQYLRCISDNCDTRAIFAMHQR